MFISTFMPSRRISDRQRFYPTLTDRHKRIAQQFFNATWGQGHVEAVDRLTSPDFIVDYPVLPAPLEREGFKAWVADIHGAFPDLQMAINEVIAEGDKVVISWTAQGTNTGRIGFLDQPATGKAVCFTGMIIYRIVNDYIVEERGEEDVLTLFRQLGVIS
jgi:steroid delta-isomerase-like uncharacterized protein